MEGNEGPWELYLQEKNEVHQDGANWENMMERSDANKDWVPVDD